MLSFRVVKAVDWIEFPTSVTLDRADNRSKPAR